MAKTAFVPRYGLFIKLQNPSNESYTPDMGCDRSSMMAAGSSCHGYSFIGHVTL